MDEMLRQLFSFSWANIFASSAEYVDQILGALRSILILLFVVVFVFSLVVIFLAGFYHIDLITAINIIITGVSFLLGIFMAVLPIIFQPVIVIIFCIVVKVVRGYHKKWFQLRLQGIMTIESPDDPIAWVQRDKFKRLSEKQKEEWREKVKIKYKCRYRLWIITFCCSFVGSIIFLAILGRGAAPDFVEAFGGDYYSELIDAFLHLNDEPSLIIR